MRVFVDIGMNLSNCAPALGAAARKWRTRETHRTHSARSAPRHPPRKHDFLAQTADNRFADKAPIRCGCAKVCIPKIRV